MTNSADTEATLHAWLAEVRDDPIAFTLGAYPWGQPGTILANFTGPDAWSLALMTSIRDGILDLNTAIQIATASGHGIGKSATVAWIVLWAFTTFPDTRGVVTANTETQLKTKTWAELGKWFNLCFFTRERFSLTATALFSKDPDRAQTWRIDMIPWSEKNPAAFAGLHNQGKRLILIFDEASEIPDIIWETAEGALSDTETQIIWLVFGNPTRNVGRFRECFDGGRFSAIWQHRQIDSRTVSITNKTYIARQIQAYGGEDNDIVRVRWLGQFPLRGLLEFFSALDIDLAMSREIPFVDRSTPLALGVDVARFGSANSVLWPRKGRDARTTPREIYNGIPTTELTNYVLNANDRLRPDGIFIDGGGVGGGVVDQCRQKGLFVLEVQFGGKDDITGILTNTSGERYANKRTAMHAALREWLKSGAIPFDVKLKTTLLAIRAVYDENKGVYRLMSKEDLIDDNPGADLDFDSVDALALTFGGPLTAHANAGGDFPHAPLIESEYNPYDPERIAA